MSGVGRLGPATSAGHGPRPPAAASAGRAGSPDALEALRSGRIQDRVERLRTATALVGSAFYQELFKAMRETVPEGGLIDGGLGEDIFSSLMDQQLAEVSAMRESRGLASALYRHFADAYLRTDAAGTEGGE
ncbi:MAG: hypothetical protein D6701_07540 [Gemmatimonadetes bacterium]|nr:MAG: hypothetical protein D6701_07540 [Gemmatimonadota bacterium]